MRVILMHLTQRRGHACGRSQRCSGLSLPRPSPSAPRAPDQGAAMPSDRTSQTQCRERARNRAVLSSWLQARALRKTRDVGVAEALSGRCDLGGGSEQTSPPFTPHQPARARGVLV